VRNAKRALRGSPETGKKRPLGETETSDRLPSGAKEEGERQLAVLEIVIKNMAIKQADTKVSVYYRHKTNRARQQEQGQKKNLARSGPTGGTPGKAGQ